MRRPWGGAKREVPWGLGSLGGPPGTRQQTNSFADIKGAPHPPPPTDRLSVPRQDLGLA